VTDPNCRRWAEISDREATGARLSLAERQWAEVHLAECATCAGESRVWQALSEVMTQPNMPDTRPAESNHARSALVRIRSALRMRRRSAWLVAAAAGLALTFSAASWLQYRYRARPIAAPLTPTVRVVSVAGEVTMGGKSVRAGEAVAVGAQLRTAQGQTCLAIDASVVACLDADSQAWLSARDGGLLRIRLERGRLMSRLDLQPPNRRYVVETSKTSITAQGTEFIVGVAADQRVSVHLHQGQLSIEGPDNQSSGLVGPAAAVINDTIALEAWSAQIVEADRNLVQLARLPGMGKPIELDVTTRPTGARVALDDLVLGPTPLSAVVHGGHRLVLSMPGFASVTEVLPTEPGERLQRNFELTELVEATVSRVTEAAAESDPKTGCGSAAVTPKGLLARAQVLRAEGKYRDCADVYRQLINSSASSDEARMALVSLGELELYELRQPAPALHAFETYLRQPGPLTREARYGRIRALQMLSRWADAQPAIAAFLKDYPSSVQAERLRRRMSGRRTESTR
jgi:hypothetical protein